VICGFERFFNFFPNFAPQFPEKQVRGVGARFR